MVNFKKFLKNVLPDNGRRSRTNTTREPELSDTNKKEEKRSSTSLADKLANQKLEDTFKSQQSISDPQIEYHFEVQESDNEDNNDHDDNADVEENEDDDEGTFAVAFDLDSSANDDKDFACLSPEEIIVQQSKEIQSVADLFSITPTVAGLLLRHFQWKKEKLIARFFENPDQVYKEAGVTLDSTTTSKAIELSGEDMCSICGDDMPAEFCTALSCAHRFCNDCWKNYLTTKIREGETKLNCPQHKCNLTVEELTVKKLVDFDVYDRYIRFVTKSFVEDSGNIKWCPQANCGNAITADMISGTIVKCSCGYRFCFSCHREAHAPATCEQVKQWERKCKDDSETEHWKYANTKDCPKCQTSVEKNGGCNHMTCRQCKHEWCWVCIRPWKGHNDYYNCNKFMKSEKPRKSWFFKGGKKDKAKEREEEREKNRVALERYLHYYERHINHSHSSELEKQIRTRAISKVNELQKEATTTSEVQYILEGTEVLFECRNVLKYTYVTGYYLPEVSSERGLFEYLQEDLEKTTEMLSEVLESSDLSKDRFSALNVIQLAKNRKANLLRGVDEGLTVDVK